MTETRQLSVIRKPAEGTRAVFRKADEEPVFRGEGDLSFVCGGCRLPLAVGVDAGQIRNVVMQCPRCKAYNETLD